MGLQRKKEIYDVCCEHGKSMSYPFLLSYTFRILNVFVHDVPFYSPGRSSRKT